MVWASKDKRNEYQRAYRVAKGIKPRVRRVAPSCTVCGTDVPDNNHRYCSSRCHRADTHDRVIAAWLAGEHNPPHGGEGRVPEYIKRWWYAEFGEKCVECGWATRRQADGRIPLTWDHVDGDCSNNRYGNVRLLLPKLPRSHGHVRQPQQDKQT
jgi:endogenous inhibitor of DNA gyrase (YacG/DUF329 family)